MMNLSNLSASQTAGLPIENLYVLLAFDVLDMLFSFAVIRRIVGLSATFSNIDDVAQWIRCPMDMLFQVCVRVRIISFVSRG